MVTVTDPEGFPVNFIHGQEPSAPGKMPEKLTVNYEAEKPRLRNFQRFEPGPAAVHKVRRQPARARNGTGVLVLT